MLRKLILSATLILWLIPFAAVAQTGAVTGKVISAENGNALPGANIRIEQTGMGTVTNAEGFFSFNSLPAGEHTLIISYVGFNDKSVEVEIEEDESNEVEIELSSRFEELEGITVTGYRGGQASALSQQRSASNIKNVISAELMRTFSDHNTAEVLERIPGVSLERDQGEGRYIQIRGTDPNLTSISINGENIPSPEGDIRHVALDVIPSNMLSSIEVDKAITPDMEGNAIGGAVNLNTLQATGSDPFFDVTLGAGYNSQAAYITPYQGQAALGYGQRFGEDEKLGLTLGASYNVSNRGTDNNENEWDGDQIEVIELKDYNLTRTRIAGTANLDYRFSPESQVFLSGMYNYFADQEYQGGMVIEPDVIERELKDRFEAQTIASIQGGGRHMLGNNFEVDYSLAYSYAQEDTDPEYVNIYVQEFENPETEEAIEFMELIGDDKFPRYNVVDGAPAGAGPLQFNSYSQDELEIAQEITTDQHFTSKLNMQTTYRLGNQTSKLKFGGLFRGKRKYLNPQKEFYEYSGNQTYSDLFGDFSPDNFFQDQYNFGQYLDPIEVRELFENERPNFQLVNEDTFVDSRAEDYEGYEYTGAGYAMTEINLGKVTAIIGARYANISTSYTAYEVGFTEEGDLIPEATELNDDRNFNFFLPMAHLKYTPAERLNFRFAWTNTYSKPNYFDLAPYRIINREDDEVELGNPGLDPTRSMNLDFMAEYYFSSVGVISAGVFYKDIEDFRYLRLSEFQGNIPGLEGFEAEQPVNGGSADVAGFELNLQQQLTFLPGFASGFGLYANYTYTWSEAEILGETNETVRTIDLPGQAQDVAHVALSYERGGFSGRISGNYHSAYVDELRNASDSDRYYDEHLQIDFSARQQITPRMGLFVEIMNLTNEPVRYYNGIPSRPEQQEYYSIWGNAGVKLTL